MTNKTTPLEPELPFEIDGPNERVRVLRWKDGSCQPASNAEIALWDALAARADLVRQNEELKAAALWVLYHHQGGLSPIGQPIRRLLGIGQWDDLTDEQMAAVKKFAMKEQPK